jgi:hypothetical protein
MRFNGLEGRVHLQSGQRVVDPVTFTVDPKSVDTNNPAFHTQIAFCFEAGKCRQGADGNQSLAEVVAARFVGSRMNLLLAGRP